MKVFRWNPETGRRGREIQSIKRASFTGQSVDYQVRNKMIKPIEYRKPVSKVNEDWTVHVDAGVGDISYLTDQWICFCLGEFKVGVLDSGLGKYSWTWVVLPPKQLIEPINQDTIDTELLEE